MTKGSPCSEAIGNLLWELLYYGRRQRFQSVIQSG